MLGANDGWSSVHQVVQRQKVFESGAGRTASKGPEIKEVSISVLEDFLKGLAVKKHGKSKKEALVKG